MSGRIRLILGLFAYFTVIYNLTYLGQWINVNLTFQPVFYIVVTIAVLGIIALSPLLKISLIWHIVGWSVIYLLGYWVLSPDSPFWMGTNIYQTLTEITLLGVALTIAYRLSTQVHKIDDLGAMISYPSSVREVRNFKSAFEDIKVEFVRSRRYNHPLSLMVIEPSKFTLNEDLDRIILENQKRISHRYLAARLGDIIVTQARRTDMILTKNWDGRFIILCPENNSNRTNILAQRIQSDVKNILGVSIQYGIAAFPNDALTFDDLLRQAETNMSTVGRVTQISAQVKDMPDTDLPSDKLTIE